MRQSLTIVFILLTFTAFTQKRTGPVKGKCKVADINVNGILQDDEALLANEIFKKVNSLSVSAKRKYNKAKSIDWYVVQGQVSYFEGIAYVLSKPNGSATKIRVTVCPLVTFDTEKR